MRLFKIGVPHDYKHLGQNKFTPSTNPTQRTKKRDLVTLNRLHRLPFRGFECVKFNAGAKTHERGVERNQKLNGTLSDD